MAEPRDDEFYVGYQETAPPMLGRFLRMIVAAVIGFGSVISLSAVLGQQTFAATRFEVGTTTRLEGTLVVVPQPMLLVERPGKTTEQTAGTSYLLVNVGKPAAPAVVA